MNINHPNYPDALSNTDRATLAQRITALVAKEARRNAAEQRRSVLLEALHFKGKASELMIRLAVCNGGLHAGYTYNCIVESGAIALSITLDGDFTEAAKVAAHGVAQVLFRDLGIERVSIGSHDERLRVNYWWCWDVEGWVVEMLEAAS